MEFIVNHNMKANAGKSTYWLEMNGFGDLSPEEFLKIRTGVSIGLRTRSTALGSLSVNATLNSLIEDLKDAVPLRVGKILFFHSKKIYESNQNFIKTMIF
jgi:hypothetical protein